MYKTWPQMEISPIKIERELYRYWCVIGSNEINETICRAVRLALCKGRWEESTEAQQKAAIHVFSKLYLGQATVLTLKRYRV